VPWWNVRAGRVLTTYRCEDCWLSSIAELRTLLTAGAPDVRAGFCDFLGHHRFRRDAERLRFAPPEEQLAVFLQLLAALEDGRLVFEP